MKNSILSGTKVVFALLAMIAVPIALTLKSVRDPVALVQTSANPTPYGYTISLLLFIVPMIGLGFWLFSNKQIHFQKKAFWLTVALLAPLGIILDILFGNLFFNFQNHEAVTGLMFPAVGGPLPVEEIVFYITGFITILLIYVWCDEIWFEKYNIPDYAVQAGGLERIVQFHAGSLISALIIILSAIFYKKFLASDAGGFPGYIIYLTLVALTPAMGLYKSAAPFINWRALSFTIAIVVLISLIWEVTLALPYQWWGFNDSAMVGIYIGAWHRLPIEEIILWICVGFTTVTVYETIKIWKVQNKPFRQAMFGLD